MAHRLGGNLVGRAEGGPAAPARLLSPRPVPTHSATTSICRLGAVSLVSKRFRTLCLAPQLVREVSVFIRSEDNAEVRLRSLRDWLAANSPPVVNFVLDSSRHEMTVTQFYILLDCLSRCCLVAPLQQLSVHFGYGSRTLTTLAWLLPVQGTLRQLSLVISNTPVAIDVPLQQFTALTTLQHHCGALQFGAGCWLPSSLTYLNLSNLEGLPVSQVSMLGDLCIPPCL